MLLKKISSSNNPLVKYLVRLRQRPDFRKRNHSVVISGKKLVQELSEITPPKRIFTIKPPLELPFKTEVYLVEVNVLKKITGLATPEEIVAEFPLPPPSSLEKKATILALDRIADPGNLGTLIRTALALGWAGVFFLPNCVDPFNEKVIRASRGALFHLPWYSGDWEELYSLIQINQLIPYVADTEGEGLLSFKAKSEKKLLLLSNEAGGVSSKGKALGKRVAIPMSEKTESLNVAVAGAILMYALTR